MFVTDGCCFHASRPSDSMKRFEPKRAVECLQNNCKRDPESYRSEFSLQWTHYEAQMELFALKPDQKSPEFCDMVHFLSHVSKCYKDIIMPFSQGVYQLLDKHVDVLHPTVRMQLLQALMHMRHQGLIEAEALLALCFRLFQCHDKPLKAALHSFIVQDIKHANSKGRNDRLNKSVQNYMYKIIEVRIGGCDLLVLSDSVRKAACCCADSDISRRYCLSRFLSAPQTS